ncbi:MAG: BsuPI-related putative proteinase inhibitor [Candidatus Hodarchaeota archaeon]
MRVEKNIRIIIFVSVVLMIPVIPMVVYSPRGLELSSTVNIHPLSLNVELPESKLRMGEAMNIALTLTNIGDHSIELAFPDTQIFDFSVEAFKGGIIYVWSWDKVFAQMILEVELSPGQSLQRTLSWTPSAPGWFELTGYTVAFWIGGWADGALFNLRAQPIVYEVFK